MNIEHELQNALRRKQPSPDFTGRVLARIEPAGIKAAPAALQSRLRHWLAAAAAAALLATGGARYYAHQQTLAEAARVNEDIRLALQITSEKLALVQARVDASLSDAQR
jgi:hypothetical protein